MLLAALFILAALSSQTVAWAQSETPALDVSGEESGAATTTERAAEIATAIEKLSVQNFGQRQAAYRFLVGCGIESVAALEKAAHSKDIDFAERCVKALAEIGRDDETVDAVVEALERLADQDEIRCAVLARNEAEQLKKTDEERAVEALEAAGARITRTPSGQPYAVMIMRDQDLVWLKMLPTLRSVSLMQQNVTDQGVKHLVQCDQIQSLTLSQTSITDAGLDQLRQMGALTSLSLSNNQFSARGIRGLAKIQGLRSLRWNSAITDEQLNAICELKQISSLSLSHVKPNEQFADLINQLDQLTSFQLSVQDLTDTQCKHLAGIRVKATLSMMGSEKITREGWKSLTEMELTRLMIYRVQLTDRDMKLIGKMTELTYLSIYGAAITDEGLLSLDSLTNLRYLSVRGTEVTEEAGKKLQEKLPNLRSVRIESQRIPAVNRPAVVKPYQIIDITGKRNAHLRVAIDDEVLKALTKEKDLHTIFLTRNTADDDQLKKAATLPIKGLVVDSDAVTDAGIAAFRNHKTLESFTVTSNKITDRCTDSLIEMPALTRLWLIEAKLTDSGAQALINGLATKNQLTWLQLSSCPDLTNEALSDIASVKSLEQITFDHNHGTDGAVLQHVRGMKSLKTVRLNGTMLQPDHLKHLAGLNLEQLYLSEANLNEGAVGTLVQNCPKLKRLGLANTNVRDGDLEAIAKLEQLEWLWLYGTNVGDEGLKHLDGQKSLKYLYVNTDTVSAEAEERFKENHPNAMLNRN